jgi:hypothetical protein
MKYLKILIAISLLCTIYVNSTELSNEEIQKEIENLFQDAKHETDKCDELPKVATPEANTDKQNNSSNTGSKRNIPQKRLNTYTPRGMGEGPSAYFFDHMNYLLLEPILKEFEEVLAKAQSLKKDPLYDEPYTLKRMATNTGDINKDETDEAEVKNEELVKLVRLNVVNKDFEPTKWLTYIPAYKIEQILKNAEWNWEQITPHTNEDAKVLIDRYDFDGDGRLNPQEFLIAMIHHNKDKRLANPACKNCMEGATELLDQLYTQLRCDEETAVTSEYIWTQFKELNKPNPGNYNMYQCTNNGNFFRTDAVVDFVRKCNPKDGFSLTKEEFVYGILLGYWNLYVTTEGVLKANDYSRNMINLRWSENGVTDLHCDDKKSIYQYMQ